MTEMTDNIEKLEKPKDRKDFPQDQDRIRRRGVQQQYFLHPHLVLAVELPHRRGAPERSPGRVGPAGRQDLGCGH